MTENKKRSIFCVLLFFGSQLEEGSQCIFDCAARKCTHGLYEYGKYDSDYLAS